MSLHGKRVVVLGGTSGIGLAVAEAVVREGGVPVAPGFVRTPLWDGMAEAEREAMYAAAGAKLPVGRVGEADDIAEACLLLMPHDFATGQTFVVDRGGVLV